LIVVFLTHKLTFIYLILCSDIPLNIVRQNNDNLSSGATSGTGMLGLKLRDATTKQQIESKQQTNNKQININKGSGRHIIPRVSHKTVTNK